MSKVPINKFNRADTAEGVTENILSAGFIPFEENKAGITLMTVFKGKESHTRRKRKKDGTAVILQLYRYCEGAEDKIFIAFSLDGKGSRKKCEHLYCKVYFKVLNDY